MIALPRPETQSRPAPRERRGTNGIALGVLFGVVLALTLFAPYRSSFATQMRFALSSESLAWLRILDSRKSERELPYLDETAQRRPDDYLLQVGRATASTSFDNLTITERPSPTLDNDRTLLRLSVLSLRFPRASGSYAHFLRYMTAAFVRVDSPDPLYRLKSTPRKATLWAIENGEKLDPDNAFWSSMKLILLLSENKTEEAVAILPYFYQKSYWESFVYEEALGQWRLYAETYGDQGAVQKIAPLSLIAFPHLQQLRASAEKLRLVAEAEEKKGHGDKAIEIRRGLVVLSNLLQAKSRWAYEALFGTEILRIAVTDSKTERSQLSAFVPHQWEKLATHYIALLTANGRTPEIKRLNREMTEAADLRNRIDEARYDASYPGIPPGIPLAALFNNWMAGIGLIRQWISLLLLAVAIGVAGTMRKLPVRPHVSRTFCMIILLFAFTLSGLSLGTGTPEAGTALVFLWSAVLLLLLARLASENGTELIFTSEGKPKGLSTVIFVLTVLFLVIFHLTRPLLGVRHPVALLLNGAMGVHPEPTVIESLIVAFMTSGIAISVLVFTLCFCWYRRVTVGSVLKFYTRHLLLPLLAGLSLCHLVHLSHTINLDRIASRAINEATQDDLQWVLTHGGG